jgi:hypothetical protein
MTFAGFKNLAHNGFGDTTNAYAWSMAWFKGKLYVGTSRNNLCDSNIVQKSLWARNVTGCPQTVNLLNLDMRAQVWAYTPQTHSWKMVYESPMVNDSINGRVLRVARDVGYRSMAVYTDRNGQTALYVGTTGTGLAYLVRTVDGTHFETIGPAGLNTYASSIRALTAYNGRLFVAPIGTSQYYFGTVNHDKVLMSDDPASGKWTAVSRNGFGDPGNVQLYDMAVFNGQLYAAISNLQGYQIWRTNAQGRAPYHWTAVVVNGAYRGSPSPTVTSMAVFHNRLYVGSAAETIAPGGAQAKGCELIAINPDDSWDLVVGDARQTAEGYKAPTSGLAAGFGSRFSVYLWQLASHDGWLYAGTYDWSVFGIPQYPAASERVAGFDLWRSHDGVHWQPMSTTGFDNPYNYGVRTLEDTPAGLFLGTANPFAKAPDHLGGLEVWLLPNSGSLARPHGVALAPSACPMAHCSPGMNGNENLSIPTTSASKAWSSKQAGFGFSLGLGCAAGTTIIVCDGTRNLHDLKLFTAGFVRAFDPQGHLLWDSRHLVNADVVGGVPLLDDQDNSYMSDSNSIISFDSVGNVRWQTPNPAHAPLVSLNMLSSGWLVGQAGIGYPNGRSLLVVVNPQTGQIANTLDLTASESGFAGEYATANTVSVAGNRLYTVTQFQPFVKNGSDPLHHGRLYAVDVSADGILRVAWSWSFEGPSGASPLVVPGTHNTIYFDGTGQTAGAAQHVVLFALQDLGSSASLLWANDLTQLYGILYPSNAVAPGIQASPAHDPRGGIWVWSTYDTRLYRFDEASGKLIEALNIPTLLNDPGAVPDSTVEIATNGGRPILLIGVLGGVKHSNSVAAIDLSTDSLLWSAAVGSGTTGATFGQYPLLPTPDGALMVVSLYDGTVAGYALN